MEALAEQSPRVRRRAVIIGGEQSAGLAVAADQAQIAPLRGVAGERTALALRLGGGRRERDVAALPCREPVRRDPAAGEIIGGEFPDRHRPANAGGERISGVVILVAALEGRHPQRVAGAAPEHGRDVARRAVEIIAQPACRRVAEPDRLQP